MAVTYLHLWCSTRERAKEKSPAEWIRMGVLVPEREEEGA